MVTIVQKEAPVLREKASVVSLKDVGTPAFKKILADMKTALDREEDGVAIAAPQIGVPLRIFLVSHRAFSYLENPEEHEDPNIIKTEISGQYPEHKDLVFINPEIIKLSRKKVWLHEGCLSVRWLYGEVSRADKATVRAYDENGKQFIRGGSGLLAQIFQHETDHLNGILFIDTARNIETITREEQEQQRREHEAKNNE
ncbi:MAG: peptide deformylase [Patescibacteria group bacterium]